MAKHDNYNTPPNKPFWKKPSGTSSVSLVTVSPGKKVQLQGQLVDQLNKWHDLLQKGGNNMKSSIMGDIKKFD